MEKAQDLSFTLLQKYLHLRFIPNTLFLKTLLILKVKGRLEKGIHVVREFYLYKIQEREPRQCCGSFLEASEHSETRQVSN